MYKVVHSGGWTRRRRRLIGESLRNLSKNMFPATLEDTVVYQIKLNSSSLSVHYEHYVICFHYLIIPATTHNKKKTFNILNPSNIQCLLYGICIWFTYQIPGCNVWHSESLLMNRLGCSTGSLGCVIDIVFSAPSFSCHSSSLHSKR